MQSDEQDGPLLRVSDLCKRFGTHTVLDGINLSLFAGDILSVIGPSGSGKSTLLRCINQLETIDGGSLHFSGRELSRRALHHRDKVRGIGMVFQGFHLFAHMTALENVMHPQVKVNRLPHAVAEAAARALLSRVRLQDHLDKYPWQLSGGQCQRVAIARALAMKPQILLFDEPTSALDPELTGEVLDTIREVAADGMTMMIVTHELQFAREISNRMMLMDNGRVVVEDEPQALLSSDRHPLLRRFARQLTVY